MSELSRAYTLKDQLAIQTLPPANVYRRYDAYQAVFDFQGVGKYGEHKYGVTLDTGAFHHEESFGTIVRTGSRMVVYDLKGNLVMSSNNVTDRALENATQRLYKAKYGKVYRDTPARAASEEERRMRDFIGITAPGYEGRSVNP